jgi:hypothetical protein
MSRRHAARVHGPDGTTPLADNGATAQARLHRTNYSQPLLDVAGHSRLVLRHQTFEDASWPSCYPKLQPPGPSKAMVSIGGAAGLVRSRIARFYEATRLPWG